MKEREKPLNPKEVYRKSGAQVREEQKKYGYITHGTADIQIASLVKEVRAGRIQGDDLTAAKALISGVANEELKYAQRTGKLTDALYAADLYDSIGQADRYSVHRRLQRAVEKAEEVKWYEGAPRGVEIRKDYSEAIQRFISKHPARRGLESKTTVTASIFGLVLGLLLLSTRMTGNVIGSLNQTSSNWIGGILFVIGLIGIFTYFKNN